nr:hypothetical protein [Micromonospora craniellae]
MGKGRTRSQSSADYDDRSTGQVVGDCGEVRHQDRDDLCGSTTADPPHQQHGRFAGPGGGQQSAEVGVCGDQHSLFLACPIQHNLIRRRCQAVVPEVLGIMPLSAQTCGNRWRQVVVDQESHAA